MKMKTKKKTTEYDKIFNIMIKSNIMNISVVSNEQTCDSENEESQKNLNINPTELEYSKVYNNTNNKPDETKSNKEETSNQIK